VARVRVRGKIEAHPDDNYIEWWPDGRKCRTITDRLAVEEFKPRSVPLTCFALRLIC
jgi:hypothetical protein